MLADVDFKADQGPKLANCRDQIATRQNLETQAVPTTVAQQDICNHLAVFHAALSERQQFREIAVAVKLSPEALVGRKLRVYWPEDDGWFLGTVAHYNAQTGQHRVEYDDGDRGDLHLAVERVRLLMHAGEIFGPAKPAELETLAKGLLTAANDKSATSPRTRKQCLSPSQEQQLKEAEVEAFELRKRSTSPPGSQEPLHQVEVHQEAISELVCGKENTKDAEQQKLLAEEQGKVQGLVVWGLTKGWPAWPALVITEEEIEVADVQGSRKNLQKGPGKVPVHYFGTQEFAWMKGKDVVSFGQGLQRGMHLCKASNRSKAAFQRALHEVSVYFLEGELPSEMVPEHNDDPHNDDEEEEQEQERVPKAAKLLKPIDCSGVRMPLKLTSSLTVLSLGRIEYLHPAFHDVKNFWPVGYCVDRLAATPASGKKETLHRCQIREAPDGSGPLFRVTPKGCKPVEANTATKAWSALFTSQDSARALGYSGAKQFGLQHPRVQRLLQGMPGAARCERYAAWPSQPPPVPHLTDEEQREREACEASMQHLPAGIQPQTAQQPAGVCHVCYVEDYSDDNLLLECDGCRALVHMDCYGVERAPQGQSWLCDVCALGPRVHHTPACVLCPVVGPPLRRTSCHRYCHVGCAQWLGETFILNGLVHGLPNVSKAKCQLTCYLCQQRYGACIQRKKHGAPMQEGTYIGGGRRMMCYCPKHSHVARTPLPIAPVPALAPDTAASVPSNAAAAPQTELEAAQRSEQQQHNIGQTSDKGLQAMFSGLPVAYQLPEHKAGCVRGLPFNHACRRGQREPDAIAAALAKRLFVAKTPYLIGAARQHQQQQVPLSQTHLTEEPFLVASTRCEQDTMPSKCQSAAKTQTQRFKEMQETVGRRLTCGKSAIHGLGAFTKQPHMPEDMVIEYAGEMVPHVVICAKQAIPVSEELTYDYRFSGKERLPCNCGATSCRGYVNKAAVQQDGLQQPISFFEPPALAPSALRPSVRVIEVSRS
ncbi:hypothetical protein WJX79_001550 [Trebouxia sp. C0005]